jgi:hypothetical protein
MEFVPHVIDGQEAESASGERFASVDPWTRGPVDPRALGRRWATPSAARCCTGSPT